MSSLCRVQWCGVMYVVWGTNVYIYIEFIEINKHKKKLQIYTCIQQLMAAHIIVSNGYLK